MQARLAVIAALVLAVYAAESADRPQLVWEGDVSDYCILKIHGHEVQATEADGTAAPHQRVHFAVKLPDTNQTLRLQMLHGRGVARFLSQPNLSNDYTATIRIDDPQPGSSRYTIALSWQESSYDQPNPPRNRARNPPPVPACCEAAAHAASWSGHVTGTVRISMRGSSSYSEVVDGELTGEHADLSEPIPHRADLGYKITKLAGGGEVRLIEPPTDANGYTLTFEIRNGQSTNTEYAVDIGWAAQPAAK